MNLFGKNLNREIVVIAELGVNHSGSLEWIMRMLEELKSAGASAAKFQLFTPDLYSSRSNSARHQFLNKVYLSKNDFLKIMNFARDIELPVFATPLSPDWVPFIADVCGVVKIASGDFTFLPTIKAALESNAMIIASTGASSEEEVADFIRVAKSHRSDLENTIALLHCVAAYPPPLSQANLLAITALRQLTGLMIGFSSHFVEDAPVYSALSLGSRIFEIHVTDDRSRDDIRDHSLSRTPKELQIMIDTMNELSKSLIDSRKSIQPVELEIRNTLRKGIVYSSDLRAGHVVDIKDLNYARPYNPLFPSFKSVVGKKLIRNVSAFHSVDSHDFE